MIRVFNNSPLMHLKSHLVAFVRSLLSLEHFACKAGKSNIGDYLFSNWPPTPE